MHDAALGVGGVAAKRALVGHLFARQVLGDGLGLVDGSGGSGPHGLPGLLLGRHFW